MNQPAPSSAEWSPPRHRILGIGVHDVTEDETVARIAQWLREGRSAQVATVNPEFVMAAQEHTAFRETISFVAAMINNAAARLTATRRLKPDRRWSMQGARTEASDGSPVAFSRAMGQTSIEAEARTITNRI